MPVVNVKSTPDVAVRALPDLPAAATGIGDAFGAQDGCPMDFGLWEMYPGQDPVEFDYAAESLCAYVIEGALEGTTADGAIHRLSPGDLLFVAQAEDAQVAWRVVGAGPFRAVFATHPHYPRV